MGPVTALTTFILSITVGPLLVIALAYCFKKLERHSEIQNSKGTLDSFGTLYINSPFSIELQEKTISRFIKRYMEVFPAKQNIIHFLIGTKDLTKARKKLTIEWIPNASWFWSRSWHTGKEFPEGHQYRQRNSGQMVGNDKIIIAANSEDLWKTAFVHELGHWALGIMTGEQDADHASSTVYGSTWTAEMDELIAEINAEIKSEATVKPPTQ